MMFIKQTLLLIITLSLSFPFHSQAQNITQQKDGIEWYHQTVNLARYSNNISQGSLRILRTQYQLEPYIGFFYDIDEKSNINQTYTDKQVSPMIGLQSKPYLNSIRTYVEYRDVNRIGNFPDRRSKQDNELRLGTFGYDIKTSSLYFNEWYYNLFYSQLYDHKIIFQGWNKFGIHIKKIDLFAELLVDSFDFTKQEQFTVDARPGIRFQHRFKNVLIQLITQYLIPIDHSGREKETRSTFVIFTSF